MPPFRVSGTLRRYFPVLYVRRGMSLESVGSESPLLFPSRAFLHVLDAPNPKLKACNPNLKHVGSSITDAAGQNLAQSVYYVRQLDKIN